MVSLRKAILLLLDIACTVLTLMTGLQENPILVSLTGRYDLIRARFDQGKISYNIVRGDLVDVTKLPQLETVSSSYRFITAPERSPSNLGEDRSTCMRVNSMSASVLAIQFDDFFGKGARREQIFLYSISAPNCNVINFKSEWLEDCIDNQFAGNITECYQYIFDNFDALLLNRQLQMGVEQDFGAPGRPFLKCLGRANKPFEYIIDLLVLQSYWADGGYHIEIQSSTCLAAPVVRDEDWQWGLFAVEAATKSAKVVCAMHESSWVASTVSLLFGIVSLIMISWGIFVTLSLDNLVKYVPRQARVPYFAPFRFPMVAFDTYAFPPQRKSDIVISRGQRFFASDMWMNHWLYIALSISDAALRVRTTYVVLEMGAWMLKKQRNFENFLFVCTALTRLTWITCFVHTLARYNLKILLKVLKKLRWVTRLPYDAMDWFIDASALFLSYKVYAVLISTILYGMLQTRGTTSFMTRQAQPTTPVFGGFANIANFWRNEIVCDLGITCAVVLVVGHFLASMLLCTRYKTLARNRLLRLLQDRYLFVGWDVFVAIEALGIDPSDKDLVPNGTVMTSCSFSPLLQQLYASGPSGLVEFAGDSVFLFDQVDERTANDSVFAPITLRYPPLDAQIMGLCTLGALQRKQTSPLDQFGDSIKLAEQH